MTDKEKARAYDEALDRCKEWASGTCRQSVNNSPKDVAEFIFPQLAESEDERIIEEIKFAVMQMPSSRQDTKNRCLAYLEKQKPMYNLEIPAGDVAPAEEDGPFDEDEFLENELSAFLQNYDKEYDDDAAVSDVAKHFYEIGKKQKEQIPYTDFVVKPHKGDENNPYDMSVSEAQDYTIKRGLDIPFNDGEVFIDERYITQTVGNILRWADEHPKEEKSTNELEDAFKYYTDRGITISCGDLKAEPKKEQKPTEWSEEDVYIATILEHLVGKNRPNEIFKIGNKQGVSAYKMCSWLKHLPERLVLQQKQELDENTAQWVECIIKDYEQKLVDEPNHAATTQAKIVTLQSLRPQPKQEWSKEDERILKGIIGKIDHDQTYGVSKTEMLSFLNSLRPQPRVKTNDYITPHKKFFKWIYNRLIDVHNENPNVDYMRSFKERINNLQFDEPQWKPSEEQMEALKCAIDDIAKFSKRGGRLVEFENRHYYTALHSLYEYLKKLM